MSLPNHFELRHSASWRTQGLSFVILALGGFLLLVSVAYLQIYLDQHDSQKLIPIQRLEQLPRGEYVKTASLGYHHLVADLLWLRLNQVIGERQNTTDQYEWMFHALEVITTLDPQYAYAYYVGGIILGDYAHRPNLSNQLLARGADANPLEWNLPFLLGYNYYFLMNDAAKGAEYLMRAASLPDGPSYLPGLATRMAAEGGQPETALMFLEARLRETTDPKLQEFFLTRMKEVILERDLQQIERAVEAYVMKYHHFPMTLDALVSDHLLSGIPQEPFGGEYQVNSQTGTVSSSTHHERLKTFYKRKQSTYVFPKSWE